MAGIGVPGSTVGRVFLAVFQGDEVYMCLQVTSTQFRLERYDPCSVSFCCCWSWELPELLSRLWTPAHPPSSPLTCWCFCVLTSSYRQLPTCLCFSHSSHEAKFLLQIKFLETLHSAKMLLLLNLHVVFDAGVTLPTFMFYDYCNGVAWFGKLE